MPRKTDKPRTREYVSHDPHTVAVLKPDALERLGAWLLATTRGEPRWLHRIDPPTRKGAHWLAEVRYGHYSKSYYGKGKTLALAIHAALDEARKP